MQYNIPYLNILAEPPYILRKLLTMNKPASIVHESETQRQFVRLQLPAMADIKGNRFTVRDLSSGGMAIKDINKSAIKGEILDVSLMLPFADFSLDIEIKAEVQHIDKKTDIAGCRFIDLNANQVSILNHVIKAFMAGDLIGANDIINVVSRENFVNVRKHPNNHNDSILDKVKRFTIYGLVTLATLALAFFIIGNIIEKLYVLKTPHGQVQATTVEILSPQSGVFTAVTAAGIKSVKTGQVIGRIKSQNITGSTGGNTTTDILSPCDCFITEQFALNGEYRPQNTPVFTLLPQDSAITVHAKVNVSDVHRLTIGTEVTINISGEISPIHGSIIDIKTNNDPALTLEAKPTAIVIIQPNRKLSNDTIGRPVFLEFHL